MECRTLVDEKIAVKEVPKDLKKLATKVLETEQVAESKVRFCFHKSKYLIRMEKNFCA